MEQPRGIWEPPRAAQRDLGIPWNSPEGSGDLLENPRGIWGHPGPAQGDQGISWTSPKGSGDPLEQPRGIWEYPGVTQRDLGTPQSSPEGSGDLLEQPRGIRGPPGEAQKDLGKQLRGSEDPLEQPRGIWGMERALTTSTDCKMGIFPLGVLNISTWKYEILVGIMGMLSISAWEYKILVELLEILNINSWKYKILKEILNISGPSQGPRATRAPARIREGYSLWDFGIFHGPGRWPVSPNPVQTGQPLVPGRRWGLPGLTFPGKEGIRNRGGHGKS